MADDVVWVPIRQLSNPNGNFIYHSRPDCYAISLRVPTLLSEAKRVGLVCCNHCAKGQVKVDKNGR